MKTVNIMSKFDGRNHMIAENVNLHDRNVCRAIASDFISQYVLPVKDGKYDLKTCQTYDIGLEDDLIIQMEVDTDKKKDNYYCSVPLYDEDKKTGEAINGTMAISSTDDFWDPDAIADCILAIIY